MPQLNGQCIFHADCSGSDLLSLDTSNRCNGYFYHEQHHLEFWFDIQYRQSFRACRGTMRNERCFYTRCCGLHRCADFTVSDYRSDGERMRRQHTDLLLLYGSHSDELSVDGSDQCHDCSGTRNADGDYCVCIELRCQWIHSRAFTELFWIELESIIAGL